jgi:HEAT repeat protein
MHRSGPWLALVLMLAAVGGASAGEEENARAYIERARRSAGSIAEQAKVLARLAWPDGPRDHLISAIAREDLVKFGDHAVSALYEAAGRVDPVYSADVVEAVIAVYRRQMSDIPPDYFGTLEEALWSGSEDAQRMAIREFALFQHPPVLMACIDAAYEHPALLPEVVRALGEFGDPRARFFLKELLFREPPPLRAAAAESLAAIGGKAMLPLHEGVLSKDVGIRHDSLRALLPRSGVNELAILYEYLSLYPEDDAELAEAVRDRATLLETLMDQRLDYESASPTAHD